MSDISNQPNIMSIAFILLQLLSIKQIESKSVCALFFSSVFVLSFRNCSRARVFFRVHFALPLVRC